jgi:hypothetical protein
MAQGDPEPLNPQRYMYRFINNVYADFLKSTLDYFANYLYPFEMSVVATYDKAVEYLVKKEDLGDREFDKVNLPALIMNPSGELDVADAIAGGKFLWRHPNLMPGFIKYIFDPIYQDQHVMVNVGFLRMKGTIELLALCASFYEYCDVRLLWIQVFGGLERWIYPNYFSSFIILPRQLINYTYSNPYTGLVYKLNWREAGAYDYLVRSTALDELVMPCEIKPIYRLTGLGDNSDRYGGTDRIADWRTTATVEYEVELPAYLVLESDYLAQRMDINIQYGATYSAYPLHAPPINRQLVVSEWDWGLDSTSASSIEYDSTSKITANVDLVFKTRYYHFITQSEADATANVIIQMPEQITNEEYLIVITKYGQLDYGDHWTLVNNGNAISINIDTVQLDYRSIVELYVYERQ